MAFGLNRAELIGRLGDDVTVNQLTSGGRVANLSVYSALQCDSLRLNDIFIIFNIML